jgi:hypothetical protein
MAQRNESAWCVGCRAVTVWSGRGERVFCEGCGTDFPCAHQCRHWDCRESKGLAAPDHRGVLKLVNAVQARAADGDPAGDAFGRMR